MVKYFVPDLSSSSFRAPRDARGVDVDHVDGVASQKLQSTT